MARIDLYEVYIFQRSQRSEAKRNAMYPFQHNSSSRISGNSTLYLPAHSHTVPSDTSLGSSTSPCACQAEASGTEAPGQPKNKKKGNCNNNIIKNKTKHRDETAASILGSLSLTSLDIFHKPFPRTRLLHLVPRGGEPGRPRKVLGKGSVRY